MVSTRTKKHPKAVKGPATLKNEKFKSVTRVKCNRIIENEESCKKRFAHRGDHVP
nr:hypothetical protein [Candidatus Sigynarchaeum springense]